MKKAISIFLLCCLVISCKQKTKTSLEQSTALSVRDTISPKAADTLKKMSDTGSQKPAANDTIAPGKSIGHISLNETTEDVIKALGEPDARDAAMGKALLTWNSKPSMKGADTIVNSIEIFTATNFGAKNEASRVKQIRITSPFFKTEGHVGCGSTIAFIKLQYPDLKKASASYTNKAGNTIMIYDDVKAGIAFEIDESTKCCGITVHKPGEKAREIYNAAFSDVKSA